jgi:hypothetical protein
MLHASQLRGRALKHSAAAAIPQGFTNAMQELGGMNPRTRVVAMRSVHPTEVSLWQVVLFNSKVMFLSRPPTATGSQHSSEAGDINLPNSPVAYLLATA